MTTRVPAKLASQVKGVAVALLSGERDNASGLTDDLIVEYGQDAVTEAFDRLIWRLAR